MPFYWVYTHEKEEEENEIVFAAVRHIDCIHQLIDLLMHIYIKSYGPRRSENI
jgi:hypothetical protein